MNYEAEKTELKRLFDYYFMLASKGVAWAQTWIADAYFWGWGVDMDYSSFIEWDTRAARNGAPISKKRMVLYYLSKGNINAAISACRIRDERIFISTHSNEYPTEVKFARFSEYSSSRFHSYLLNPENQLINKSIEQIISDFEVYLNNDNNDLPHNLIIPAPFNYPTTF